MGPYRVVVTELEGYRENNMGTKEIITYNDKNYAVYTN